MFRFGDIIENGWASEGNPNKRGYFVQIRRRSGRLNPGDYIVMTNGRGKFWEVSKNKNSRLTKIKDSTICEDLCSETGE